MIQCIIQEVYPLKNKMTIVNVGEISETLLCRELFYLETHTNNERDWAN